MYEWELCALDATERTSTLRQKWEQIAQNGLQKATKSIYLLHWTLLHNFENMNSANIGAVLVYGMFDLIFYLIILCVVFRCIGCDMCMDVNCKSYIYSCVTMSYPLFRIFFRLCRQINKWIRSIAMHTPIALFLPLFSIFTHVVHRTKDTNSLTLVLALILPHSVREIYNKRHDSS